MFNKASLRNAFNAAVCSLADDAAGKAKVALFTVMLGTVAVGAFGLPFMPLAMIFGAAAGSFGVPAVVAGCKAYGQAVPKTRPIV